MSWFEKLLPKVSTAKKKGVPEGVWSKCDNCQATLYRAELEDNFHVCVKCGHHLRLSGRRRLEVFLDPDGRLELGQHVRPETGLSFAILKSTAIAYKPLKKARTKKKP